MSNTNTIEDQVTSEEFVLQMVDFGKALLQKQSRLSKFKVDDCVEVTSVIGGETMSCPVTLPKGAVGIVDSVNLEEDNSISYNVIFRSETSNLSIVAKFVPEASLSLFS